MAQNPSIPRLIRAARDIVPSVGVMEARLAGAPHRRLLTAYVAEMQAAQRDALTWWEGIVDTEEARVGDRGEAELNVKLRRPAGPAAHGRVIDVIRRYWLQCAALNAEETGPFVEPAVFLLAFPAESGHAELSAFVATLPFWPIGQDADGRWI